MNLAQSKLLPFTNVYSACNGEYRENQQIDKKYVADNRTTHKIISHSRGLNIIVDKEADDFDKVVVQKGRTVPPDEILEMLKTGLLKIPIVDPKDKDGNSLLPCSDLLKNIHYFVSRKYLKDIDVEPERSKYVECMNETSLLAMGMLVESWVDELVTEDVCKMFLQEVVEKKSFAQEIEEDEIGDEGTPDENGDEGTLDENGDEGTPDENGDGGTLDENGDGGTLDENDEVQMSE
ncbi:hypothetical protein KGF56_002616 [Candida oxycetoniae]|uniref:Uncharacterized protein n=1 Tax=Candida oxycetoniae TaxID=497107 RepID=A0AAI9SXI9_9ASCO|nr:uncharacterized protein KGF56_002616 [Candida oxycetoniae]KAI3404571.1 hypothetical protein KGF56_002616 [Candida oxycetoniae]